MVYYFRMHSESRFIQLMSIDLAEAKRIQSILSERGVSLVIHSEIDDCCEKKSCKPSVQVYVLEQDLPRVNLFFQEEKHRLHEGLQFDSNLLDEVFDPDRGEARCPACGTQFSTSQKTCPDCGLVFIPEEVAPEEVS